MSFDKMLRNTLAFVVVAGLLLGSAVFMDARGDTINEDPEALEQLRLLEILKSAKPAPAPPPFREYSEDESASTEHRGIVEHDLMTGETTIVPAQEVDFLEGLPPDEPFEIEIPSEAQEVIEGIADEGEYEFDTYPAIIPTPPTPRNDATTYPWNTIHKLLMRFNVAGTDYFYVCSGMATGPFHILTAGHCIYNWDPNDDGDTSDKTWASEIWMWAGQGDVVNPVECDFQDQPYGEAKAVYLRTYTGWTDSMNYDHDWGVITLNRRDGDHTGWMGRETATTDSLNFSGYPTQTPYVPACTRVQYKGYDTGNVRGYTSGRIQLDAYIYGGHSGGPSWRYWEGDRWIQGIHSTSNRVGYAEDTRLTSGKRGDLNDFMDEDETARPPTARPDLIEYYFDGNNAKDLLTNSVEQGGNISVEHNVLNSGFASSSNFTVTFYLSTNKTISTYDTPIGTRTRSLNAWTFTNPTATLTVPTTVPAGTYYVGWIMSGGATEYATGNNSVVIGDETLTVTLKRSITVTSPNGGETWFVGENRNITWTSENAGSSVKIEISRDGGSTWSVITNSTANDGSYGWTVTGPASTACRVRITSTTYPSVSDVSNSNFTIQEVATGTIYGTVTDRQTGKPIKRAKIIAKHEDGITVKRTKTDASGYYELTGLKAGLWKLKAKKRGYRKKGGRVDVSPGGKYQKNFRLRPKT